MSAIEATCLDLGTRHKRPSSIATQAVIVVLTLLALTLLAPSAHALSSTGKLAFYPCTDCHPVAVGADGTPIGQLPGGKQKHEIELESHDILGEGDEACLACHSSPQDDPGELLLPDGSTVDITGEVSRVCQRCHFEKYRDFQLGIHGRGEDKCSAAGCHDPHTPGWIYVAALPPFQGTGIEVKAVAPREPFTPMASPPVAPPVTTPGWLVAIAVAGTLVVFALTGFLVFGRRKA